MIRVFTDGACSNNGKKGAKASWACWFPEHPDISKAEVVPEDELQTNQRGELMAIARAVEIASDEFDLADTGIHIFTDSMYSKNCLTTWIPGWIRKDWKNSTGQPVAHRDLIEATVSRLTKFKSYIITYVPAHTGKDDDLSHNNDIVDKMASRLISPEESVKIIQTNTESVLDGFPMALMGPPISEASLLQWAFANMDKIDKAALNSALLSAISKTVKKKGFEIVKQKLHRSTMYRLTSASQVIKEGAIIIKDD
jgi:ribonuclease HI